MTHEQAKNAVQYLRHQIRTRSYGFSHEFFQAALAEAAANDSDSNDWWTTMLLYLYGA